MLDENHISYELVDVIQEPKQETIMYTQSGSHGVPQVAIENILIYDYSTEEMLVQDIQKILSIGPVSSNDSVDLTSQFVFITA
jgi:glutaredoxin